MFLLQCKHETTKFEFYLSIWHGLHGLVKWKIKFWLQCHWDEDSWKEESFRCVHESSANSYKAQFWRVLMFLNTQLKSNKMKRNSYWAQAGSLHNNVSPHIMLTFTYKTWPVVGLQTWLDRIKFGS